MHKYERWILIRYLAKLLGTKRFAHPPQHDADILRWIVEYSRALRLPPLKQRDDMVRRSNSATEAAFAQCWKAWRTQVLTISQTQPPEPSPFHKRITWLCEVCTLNLSQSLLLDLFTRIARNPCVSELVAAANEQMMFKDSAAAHFDASELRPFLDAKIDHRDLEDDGLLFRLGFIDNRKEFRLSDLLCRLMAQKTVSPRYLREQLLGPSAAETLTWDDFSHLAEMRDLAARLIADGGREKSHGAVNVLIYGPPGTGKSEFAKTLGAHLGYAVRFVGEADERRAEPNRRERIAGLMLANAMGCVTDKMIIVVDEADDLFAGVDEDDASTRHGSKVFMNRLVENSSAPTIWITNDLHRLGPAVVRRMNLVIRFPKPGLKVRRTMVEHIARRAEFPLDVAAIGKLADLPASPALIENAIRSSARIRGSDVEALAILKTGLCALGSPRLEATPTPIAFDPALSSADADLATLATRVAAAPTKALSFLLSGPPGTGKSAYARYLAQALDLEVMERRYSDLTSMFLGESEKAIAEAFEEAADRRAFLILDEADSLLRDRSAARYSWEVTQVNEMLTWMERHPYPFACTTNAADCLDPATARRFLFKVQFRSMSAEQVSAAFHRSFGMEAPEHLLKTEGLSPGDFAVVARKATILGENNAVRLADLLIEEVLARPGQTKNRIGF